MKNCLNKRIMVQGQGGAAFQTAGALKEVPLGCILAYVEDLNRSPNAGIGPKDLFFDQFLFILLLPEVDHRFLGHDGSRRHHAHRNGQQHGQADHGQRYG